MMDIVKLAIEHGSTCYTGQEQYHFDKRQLEAFAKAYAQQQSEPVAEHSKCISHLWEMIGRWSAYLASNGEDANLAPPDYLIDAIKNATQPPNTVSIDRAEYEAMKADAERWNFVMHDANYCMALFSALPKDIHDSHRHINNAIDQARKI